MKKRLTAFVLACLMMLSVSALAVSAETLDFIPETRNGKIYGIPVDTNERSVDLAYYNAVVEVLDSNGKAVSAKIKIGTGFTVKLNSISYTAVVMGDINGDGELTSSDYIAVKRAYLRTLDLSTISLEAAGVKAGDEIRAVNYIMIKRAYFNTYNMNREYTSEPYDPVAGESGWTPGWV